MPPLETYNGTVGHVKLEYHATVRELPSGEHPRERLRHFGPQALSTAELLAIVLRTGTRGDNALEMASKLLTKYGGLSGLVRAEHGPGEGGPRDRAAARPAAAGRPREDPHAPGRGEPGDAGHGPPG